MLPLFPMALASKETVVEDLPVISTRLEVPTCVVSLELIGFDGFAVEEVIVSIFTVGVVALLTVLTVEVDNVCSGILAGVDIVDLTGVLTGSTVELVDVVLSNTRVSFSNTLGGLPKSGTTTGVRNSVVVLGTDVEPDPVVVSLLT